MRLKIKKYQFDKLILWLHFYCTVSTVFSVLTYVFALTMAQCCSGQSSTWLSAVRYFCLDSALSGTLSWLSALSANLHKSVGYRNKETIPIKLNCLLQKSCSSVHLTNNYNCLCLEFACSLDTWSDSVTRKVQCLVMWGLDNGPQNVSFVFAILLQRAAIFQNGALGIQYIILCTDQPPIGVRPEWSSNMHFSKISNCLVNLSN